MHKLTRFIAVAVISAYISSTAVFAANPTINDNLSQQVQKVEQNDPVKLLEQRKSDILQKLNDGKITKEEASKKIEKLINCGNSTN